MKYLNEYINELSDLITSDNGNPYRINISFIKTFDENGIDEILLNDLTKEKATEMIINLNTTSLYTIYNMIRALKDYIKWCINKGYIQNINAIQVWENLPLKEVLENKLRNTKTSQYIDPQTFKRVYFDIQLKEEYNELYYRTLFRAIYEGIYEGYEAIYNLTLNDINLENNSVHIHTKTADYVVYVSKQLISDLLNLHKIEYWETNSKFNTVRVVQLESQRKDCIFKSIKNFDSQFFFKKIRHIGNNYFGYKISAKNIFKSGLINRMNEQAKKENIDLKDIINGKDRLHNYIILDELKKFNLESSYREFRKFMKTYINNIE